MMLTRAGAQYMNGLSYQIDVDVTIAEAEVLCLSLHALIEQKEHPSDPIVSAALPTIDDQIKSLVSSPTVS